MESELEIQAAYVVGSFVLALIGVIIIALVTTWVIRKAFPPKTCPNGNGNNKDNGKVEQKLDALIKVGTDNGKVLVENGGHLTKMADILTERDQDGVPKVHNKPSVEKIIRDTWAKVKNLTGNGGN